MNTTATSYPKLLENVRQAMILSSRSTLAILGVLYFAWLIWNLWYSIPSVDDFCYGYGGHLHGILGNVAVIYQEWSGRYLATFFISLFAHSEQILLHHYYLVPLSILLFNLYALRSFLQALSENSVIVLLGMSALLMSFFQVRQSLYWLSGGATYGLACGIFLLLMAEEFKVFSAKVPLTKARAIAITLGSLLLAGCNEGAALGHLALLGPLTLLHYYHSKQKRIFWLLLGALFGVLLSSMAPGNFVRLSGMHEHMGILNAAWGALVLIGKRYLLALIILVLLLNILMRLFPARSIKASISAPHIIAFTVCMFFALWAGTFVRVYVMGDLGPSRTRTQDFMLVIMMAYCIVSYFNARRTTGQSTQPFIAPAQAFGMLMVIMFSTWLLSAFNLYPYQSWSQLITITRSSADLNQFMSQRFDLALSSKGQSLEVPAYPEKNLMPITYFSDITADEMHWENICFSNYFGLKSIIKKPQ